MIPGLLHGRSLNGGSVGGIVAAPAYLPRRAFASGSSSAAAAATFTINPDGTWTSTGASYTDESGSYYLPTTVGAGVAYEVRVTPTLLGGGGAVISNSAANWAAASVQQTLDVVIQRFTSGASIATYSVLVEFRPAGGGAIVSSGSFNLDVEADVTADGGGGGCPTLDMILPDGRTAGQVEVGDCIQLFNPDTGEEMDGEVVHAETELQPCVETIASNGARFRCSITAPMATTAGEVKAPDLRGYRAKLKVDGVNTALPVVDVRTIGDQLVRHITVRVRGRETVWSDRYFWIGGGDGTFWGHHNAKNQGD